MTSTSLRDGVYLHRYPGASCLATISLSLRDKSHSPIEAADDYLSACAGKPWAKLTCPFGPYEDAKHVPGLLPGVQAGALARNLFTQLPQ
jgi:hypothetical protein